MLGSQTRISSSNEIKFDFVLFSAISLLVIIGLTAIYSSTLNHPTAGGNFAKQLFWVVGSFIIFFITFFLHSRTFHYLAIPAYLFSLVLLVAVMFMGKTVYGAKSWLDLGPVGFQPSEFAKIGTILLLASYLGREKTNLDNLGDKLVALAIGFVPVALILLEPDMGTSLVFLFIITVMLYWKGLSLFLIFFFISPLFSVLSFMFGYYVFGTVLIIILLVLISFKKGILISSFVFVMNVGAGFFFDFFYKALKPHQQKRIDSFLDPYADPLGAGYNAIQAKVAIGSGGFLGKGFLNGNQTQLQYIPEQWTDFIFCVIGEEFGFIGSVITISLFLIIFLRLLKLASSIRERNEFASMIVVGIFALLFVHFIINIGMTVGIMPVIGVPLPFVSYGGSSLLVNVFLMGIVVNIYRNKK